MTDSRIELIYFDGCPNAHRARAALRAVLEPGSWTEWNLSDEGTPAEFRRYGSPTVLIDGRDVTGAPGDHAATACRTDGAPSPEAIRRALPAAG